MHADSNANCNSNSTSHWGADTQRDSACRGHMASRKQLFLISISYQFLSDIFRHWQPPKLAEINPQSLTDGYSACAPSISSL